MSEHATGQVTASAAEVYEAFFLPALFQEWTERVAKAARVGPGQHVLDVACGTGVLARTLVEYVHPGGAVVGLDVNDGMLAVARKKAPEVVWIEGAAESLPFDDAGFDAVVCQFGLMFFADRPAALREMMRVLRPGGRLAVAVWDRLDRTPGYAAMTSLLQRLFGDDVAASLHAPYALGEIALLQSLFDKAGVADIAIATHVGTARFPSIQQWVYTDVKGWTASDQIDDAGFDLLVAEAERELQRFVTPDGTVVFEAPAHIVSVAKPR